MSKFKLFAFERRLVAQCSDILVPSSTRHSEAAPDELVEGFMQLWTRPQRLAFRGALLALQGSPLVFQRGGLALCFSRLNRSGQESLIRRLESDRSDLVRGVWKLIRTVIYYAWYGQVDELRAHGFDPQERIERARRLREEQPADSSLRRENLEVLL